MEARQQRQIKKEFEFEKEKKNDTRNRKKRNENESKEIQGDSKKCAHARTQTKVSTHGP